MLGFNEAYARVRINTTLDGLAYYAQYFLHVGEGVTSHVTRPRRAYHGGNTC